LSSRIDLQVGHGRIHWLEEPPERTLATASQPASTSPRRINWNKLRVVMLTIGLFVLAVGLIGYGVWTPGWRGMLALIAVFAIPAAFAIYIKSRMYWQLNALYLCWVLHQVFDHFVGPGVIGSVHPAGWYQPASLYQPACIPLVGPNWQAGTKRAI